MESRTTGLILRTRPLTETSLIVHWLTADLGRICTVAKGARRPKSPFRGKLDLYYLCELSFARSRRSDLHTLREISIREWHAALRRELGWIEQAAYATALIELTTETETPLPELFVLLLNLVQHLPQHPPQPQTVFAFEMKLLGHLGQAPDPDTVQITPGSRQILSLMITAEWATIGRLKLTAPQVVELSQFLEGFLQYHLGKIPRGRGAALAG